MRTIKIKRGLDLSLAIAVNAWVNGVQVVDLTGWTLRAQVRRSSGELVADLAGVIVDPLATPQIARLYGPTADWPLDGLMCDVVLAGPGGSPVIPSDTICFEVTRTITEIAP